MDTRRGRGPGTKGAALSLRIPAHLRAQIDEKVKETGTNTSHVVETLLMEALGSVATQKACSERRRS